MRPVPVKSRAGFLFLAKIFPPDKQTVTGNPRRKPQKSLQVQKVALYSYQQKDEKMTQVFHRAFGEGEVIAEDDQFITIDFESRGEKKMIKGVGLQLYSSEEEMEEALEEVEERKAAEQAKLNKAIPQKNDNGETIYEIRRRLQRQNLPSSMR